MSFELLETLFVETPAGFVREREDGERIVLSGWSMRVMVDAAHTGSRLTILDATMAPGHQGPIEHVHRAHDEAFFILEGSLRFRVGSGYREVSQGELVFAPRGLAHGFSNPSANEARYLAMLSPSGYEHYFRRVAEMVRASGGPLQRSEIIEIMLAYDTDVAPAVEHGGQRTIG